MPDTSFHSSDQITRYILASGESDNIDAKGPMSWDGAVSSASLAKDVAAFANSRDGGVLVIGKDEPSDGQFELTGLTKQQADSFETTKVASWINAKFSPPVSLICHRQEFENKLFVIITIAEFNDVPIFCTKSYPHPNDPKKLLLKERTIYVRNSNAESAPIGTVEELRALIGLATKKRADQLLETLHAMLKGQPLVAGPSDKDKYDTELAEVLVSLDADAKDWGDGTWQLVFYPSNYRPDRWPNIDDLEALIHNHSVRIQGEFPGSHGGIDTREWGVSSDTRIDQWALTRSGLFMLPK